jgi:hypothetical protein
MTTIGSDSQYKGNDHADHDDCADHYGDDYIIHQFVVLDAEYDSQEDD